MEQGHYDKYQAERYEVFLVLLSKGEPGKPLGLGGLYLRLVNWPPQGNQAPVVSVGTHRGVPGIWVKGNSLSDFAATLRVGAKGGKTVVIAHCLAHTTFEALPRIPGLFRNSCRHYPVEPKSFVWAQPGHVPSPYPFIARGWAPRLG